MVGRQFSILVVDDEPNIRLGSERILRGTGFDVHTAESGEQGLEVLQKQDCNILLLDLMMPGMGGMEVLKQVSVLYPELIVIVITGYATLETAVEAMKLGAYDFIAKPFQPDQLRIVVSRSAEKLRLKEEHKRLAEERLKNLRDIELEKTRTRSIVQCMSEGVLLTDCAGNVVLCNPAARNFLKVDSDPHPGSSVDAYIPDIPLRELVLDVCSCSEGSPEQICSQEVELPDGTWLLAKVSPIVTEEGDETGALTVLSDITTQKDLAQMKSEFVAKVSHELRSPLASMNQQLSVVLSDLPQDEFEENKRRIERVRERTKGLLELISDLLDLSRIELGVLTSKREIIDPIEILAHVTELIGPRIDEKGIKFDLSLPENREIKLEADPTEIESVYINLLSNAVKYTPNDGKISVKGHVDDGILQIAFSDTGIGIEQEELTKIFEKFYRVKSSETRMIVGTGLGLPIVKSILDGHQASLDVRSDLGQGSTFTISFKVM